MQRWASRKRGVLGERAGVLGVVKRQVNLVQGGDAVDLVGIDVCADLRADAAEVEIVDSHPLSLSVELRGLCRGLVDLRVTAHLAALAIEEDRLIEPPFQLAGNDHVHLVARGGLGDPASHWAFRALNFCTSSSVPYQTYSQRQAMSHRLRPQKSSFATSRSMSPSHSIAAARTSRLAPGATARGGGSVAAVIWANLPCVS